jgi:hypothetical protein
MSMLKWLKTKYLISKMQLSILKNVSKRNLQVVGMWSVELTLGHISIIRVKLAFYFIVIMLDF